MSKSKLSENFIRNTVKRALNEDLYPSGDITSDLIKNNKIISVKLISNENCVLSIFSYFACRDTKDLHSHYFEIKSKHRKNYPKIIEKGHTCNWSYFIDGEFQKKKSNGII